jgi:hypothetical protein
MLNSEVKSSVFGVRNSAFVINFLTLTSRCLAARPHFKVRQTRSFSALLRVAVFAFPTIPLFGMTH